MAYPFDVPLGMVLAGVLLLLLIGAMVVVILRARRPDPKMELLLLLMRDFPREDLNGNPDDRGSEVGFSRPLSKAATQ